MAPWVMGLNICQIRNSTDTSWVNTPGPHSVIPHEHRRVRGYYTVNFGTGGIPVGEGWIEIRKIGESWREDSNIKLMPPNTGIGFPNFSEYNLGALTGDAGDYELRQKIRWGDPGEGNPIADYFSAPVHVINSVGATIEGTLDPFFNDEEGFAVLARIAGGDLLRGIFRDPYRRSLGCESSRPTLMLEEGLTALAHGMTVEIPSTAGEDYKIVGIRPKGNPGPVGSGSTTTLILEEQF